MKKRNLMIFSITMIIFIISGLLYISYGFVVTNIEGNEQSESLSLTSRTLKIEYSDGNEFLTSNSEGYFIPGATLTKTFTITNKGNTALNFNILLDDVVNSFIRNTDLIYELYLEDKILISDIFPITSSIIAYNLSIEENETQKYTLKIIYKTSTENQIDDNGKTISAKLSFEENKNILNKFNIYGNTIATLSDGATSITPDTPATLKSLGTLISDTTDENYRKYKIDVIFKESLYNFTADNLTFNPNTNTNYRWGFDLGVLKAGYYTLSFALVDETNIPTYIYFKKKDLTGNISHVAYITTTKVENNPYTFYADGTTNYYINFALSTYETNTETVKAKAQTLWSKVKYMQLEEGTVATEYKEYSETIKSIYLDEPLRCIEATNTACDYIDIVNKQVVRNVKKISLSGNENWIINEDETNSYFYEVDDIYNTSTNNEVFKGYSNYYPSQSQTALNDSNISYGIINIYEKSGITIKDTSSTTIEEFKSKLSSWNSASNPLVIFYQLNSSKYYNIAIPNLYLEDKKISVTDGVIEASKVEYE